MEFIETKAHQNIQDFLKLINKSIQTEKQTTNPNVNAIINSIRDVLVSVHPEKGDHRFGNPAFTKFISKVTGIEYAKHIYADAGHIELQIYINNSFGNSQRIDYGTGHELNFLCFLNVLYRMKVVKITEVFKCLDLYFDLAREIITKYNLEPAGSHGAWGIDDYQILPFLFGAGELCNTKYTFDYLLNTECNWVYSKAIRFVNKQKTKYREVPFKVHSPFLYELSNKKWAFVNYELMDRYSKDVLDSRAVNQHFIYSNYLPKDVCPKETTIYDF